MKKQPITDNVSNDGLVPVIETTNFKPILFSTSMVQAILSSKKKQTRRVVRLPNFHPSEKSKAKEVLEIKDGKLFDGNNELIGLMRCPYGKLGSILWVRESFSPFADKPWSSDIVSYKTSAVDATDKGWKWKPSIHMPRAVCRLFLNVIAVRVERLQDISSADIIKEGVDYPGHFVLGKENSALKFLPLERNFKVNPPTDDEILYALWAELWCKINGRESWDSNPWVWVIEFDRTEKPTGFL